VTNSGSVHHNTRVGKVQKSVLSAPHWAALSVVCVWGHHLGGVRFHPRHHESGPCPQSTVATLYSFLIHPAQRTVGLPQSGLL